MPPPHMQPFCAPFPPLIQTQGFDRQAGSYETWSQRLCNEIGWLRCMGAACWGPISTKGLTKKHILEVGMAFKTVRKLPCCSRFCLWFFHGTWLIACSMKKKKKIPAAGVPGTRATGTPPVSSPKSEVRLASMRGCRPASPVAGERTRIHLILPMANGQPRGKPPTLDTQQTEKLARVLCCRLCADFLVRIQKPKNHLHCTSLRLTITALTIKRHMESSFPTRQRRVIL